MMFTCAYEINTQVRPAVKNGIAEDIYMCEEKQKHRTKSSAEANRITTTIYAHIYNVLYEYAHLYVCAHVVCKK